MFEDFWASWPDKRNKESARKAFAKLRRDEPQKAADRAAEWCRQWRKENPQASHIHAATYLNQRRFLDMDEQAQSAKVDERAVMEMQANWIRQGKDFLCRSITATRAAAIVEAGLVTESDCRRVGVL